MYGFLRRFLPKPAAVAVCALIYAALIVTIYIYSIGANAEFRYIDI